MHPIQANPLLPFDPLDWGLRFVGATLQAPTEVVRVFARLGIRDAEALLPMMDALPSAFTGSLHVSHAEFVRTQEALSSLFAREGVRPLTGGATGATAFGANPPPLS